MTIDILMPFYGDPGQFKEAVLSVVNQSDPDWRLVIVNDCYPHWDPEPWVAELGDDRVTLLRNPRNLGVQGSFDRCIDLAENEYVTILGCDDRLLPNYVSDMRALIDRFDRPEYLQPGVRVIDETGAVSLPLADRIKRWVQPRLEKNSALSGESVVTTLMRGNWTYFPAICWRVDQLQKFRFSQQFEIVLDLAMQFDILLSGGRFAVALKPAFEYRRHSESASSYSASDGTRFIEERDFYRSAAKRLHARKWHRASRAARWRVTSRLNAFSKLPLALLRRDWTAARLLTRLGFS